MTMKLKELFAVMLAFVILLMLAILPGIFVMALGDILKALKHDNH